MSQETGPGGEITEEQVDQLASRLHRQARSGGYHLNPDAEFTRSLVRGLIKNEFRYGYQACPCRLAAGEKQDDLDIICPCDYRDPDIEEFGACLCALYVSAAVAGGEAVAESIPERRPRVREDRPQFRQAAAPPDAPAPSALPYPVWRCRVCGYLCARDEPPGVCPVCKAKKERFERFM